MPAKDYYDILGVRFTASEQEIGLAYKGRRTQYHPDKYSNSDEETVRWATSIMQEVNEAYAVLSDAGLRKTYDLNYGGDANKDAGRGTQGQEPRQPPKHEYQAKKETTSPRRPSWKKAFLITPIVTWIISYIGYGALGFTPAAYVLSGVPTGIVSAMLYYYLIPKSKFAISAITYAALYAGDQYLPATEAAGELQSASHVHDNAFAVAASVGILISLFIRKRTSSS